MLECIPSLKPDVVMKLLELATAAAKEGEEVSYGLKFIDHTYERKSATLRYETVKVRAYTKNVEDVAELLSDRSSSQLLEVSCTIRSTDKDQNRNTIYRKYHIDIISATLEVSKFGDKNAWDIESLKAAGIQLGWGRVREIKLIL